MKHTNKYYCPVCNDEGVVVYTLNNIPDTINCASCCPHDERDHGICLDCGDEEDPGVAIDRAMDALEDR